jgi:hypothetical protein
MTALCKIYIGKYVYSFPKILTTIFFEEIRDIKIDVIQDTILNADLISLNKVFPLVYICIWNLFHSLHCIMM